jgi:hypothetical protein
MKEEQPIFKVTDRRLFNADGTPRDVLPEEQPSAKPEQQPQKLSEPPAVAGGPATQSSISEPPVVLSEPGPATASAAAEDSSINEPAGVEAGQTEEEAFDEAGIPDAADPASFINFAMSIASNAASSLGLMEHPATGKREVDLELGKHWIDVLGMLQKKTKGNLTPQEAQIVEGWLADLRMQFVSLTSAKAPKAAGYTGRDIIGGK